MIVPNLNPDLPINARAGEISAAIAAHQVVVICGETGSGKTTQLPQILLGMGRLGLIGHTQPRRIAARSVAARIAEELRTNLGGLVGFKIRFDDETSPETRIKLMTDGVLLAETRSDATLAAYETIIIDEAHERSLNVDFLLGYLKQLLPRRPELKVIITSATIDPHRFSDHFGGPSRCPVIEVSGRTFPVDLLYRPADLDEPGELESAVVSAASLITGPTMAAGDCLVFLPGEKEIHACQRALARAHPSLDILPLFGRMASDEQDRIFRTSSRQRMILATNVAETSLTVPGIRYVIDTGLARISRFDPETHVQHLVVEPISRASAKQRAGRCGRVAAGVCIRLYSKEDHDARPAFTIPEILRSNLASVILRMKTLDLGTVAAFPFLEPPPASAVDAGVRSLFELGALENQSETAPLTPLGHQLAQLPIDPRLARVLIAAKREGCIKEGLALAAALAIPDPRERPASRRDEADRLHERFRSERSDFLTLLAIWDELTETLADGGVGALAGWSRRYMLSFSRLRDWLDMHSQLRDIADGMGLKPQASPASEDSIHRALLAGLVGTIAARDESSAHKEYMTPGGERAILWPGSTLFRNPPKWVMGAEFASTSRLFIRTVARIEPDWVKAIAPHLLSTNLANIAYDEVEGAAFANARAAIHGISLGGGSRVRISTIDPIAARRAFITEALVRGRIAADVTTVSGATSESIGRPNGHPALRHNLSMLWLAERAKAALRKPGSVAPDQSLHDFFDQSLPSRVVDAETLFAWLNAADPAEIEAFRLRPNDVLAPGVGDRFTPDVFPASLHVMHAGETVECPIEYRFEQGKSTDGPLLTVPLFALPSVDTRRLEWLIPGRLEELIAAILKRLPKATRNRLDNIGDTNALARDIAQLLTFGLGDIRTAIAETLAGLHSLLIPAHEWTMENLPDHLVMQVRVVDDHGTEVGLGRDIEDLKRRLEGRIRKASAGRARASFERTGLTSWTFPDLPDSVPLEVGGESITAYPTLIDTGTAADLTLLEDAVLAASHTRLGLRRLFALAIRDECLARLDAWAGLKELARHFAAVGTTEDLNDGIVSIVADRVFLLGQPDIRTHAAFDERLQANWGRIGQTLIDTATTLAGAMDARFNIAHRLSGGTSRMWATSIADIREHAAYLMPRGFLRLTPWPHLREFPRYVTAMRERLFRLREDGSGVETVALKDVLPRWKRFTGLVAKRMSDQKVADASAGLLARAALTKRPPLPGARRAAPSINLEAGEWAMQVGSLSKPETDYRWLLEELRVACFAPEMPSKATPAALDAAWKKEHEDER